MTAQTSGIKKQLAGLVVELRAGRKLTGQYSAGINTGMKRAADKLDVILATLLEPGVVSHQAVLAANEHVPKTTMPIMTYGQVQTMLEAALPYLVPAGSAVAESPVGDAVRCCKLGRDWVEVTGLTEQDTLVLHGRRVRLVPVGEENGCE